MISKITLNFMSDMTIRWESPCIHYRWSHPHPNGILGRMLNRRTAHRSPSGFLVLALIAVAALMVAAYFVFRDGLPTVGFRRGMNAETASTVSDANGLARVESAAGAVDFQVTSGLG